MLRSFIRTGLVGLLGVLATVGAARAAETMRAAGFERVEYIELRDAETLMPSDDPRRPRRMLAAAWLDGVRLIDNIPV